MWLPDAPGKFLGSPLIAKKAFWRAPGVWCGALRWDMPLKGWLQFCHLPEGPEWSLSWPILSLLKPESRLPIFREEKKKCGTCFLSLWHSATMIVRGTFPLEVRFAEPPPCLVLYWAHFTGEETEDRRQGITWEGHQLASWFKDSAQFQLLLIPNLAPLIKLGKPWLVVFFFFFVTWVFLNNNTSSS